MKVEAMNLQRISTQKIQHCHSYLFLNYIVYLTTVYCTIYSSYVLFICLKVGGYPRLYTKTLYYYRQFDKIVWAYAWFENRKFITTDKNHVYTYIVVIVDAAHTLKQYRDAKKCQTSEFSPARYTRCGLHVENCPPPLHLYLGPL